MVRLRAPQVKQIAGRAGRYKIAPTLAIGNASSSDGDAKSHKPQSPSMPDVVQSPGMVTTLSKGDLQFVKHALNHPMEPLQIAGILPPRDVLVAFASLFPTTTPFSYLLNRMYEIAQVPKPFRLCREEGACLLADLLQRFPNIQVQDRITFCEAPISRRAELKPVVIAIAERVDQNRLAPLLELEDIHMELLDQQDRFDDEYLEQLEALHEALVLYTWLSYRLDHILVSRALASHAKVLVQERIEKAVADRAQSSKEQSNAKRQRQRNALRMVASNITGDTSTPAPEEVAKLIGQPTIPRHDGKRSLHPSNHQGFSGAGFCVNNECISVDRKALRF